MCTNHKPSTGAAEEISPHTLEESEIKLRRKIKAVTVDNADNMDVAVERLRDLKIERFVHRISITLLPLINGPLGSEQWFLVGFNRS